MFKKKEKESDDFWREYEEETGEKVIARSLGQYISGWEDFDRRGWTSVWGLIIATSGGFRFHHFPQNSWIDSLVNISSRKAPKEKTFFIQKERILSARLIKETRWWKKIFSATPPHIIIHYRGDNEEERRILLEAELNAEDLVLKLCQSLSASGK